MYRKYHFTYAYDLTIKFCKTCQQPRKDPLHFIIGKAQVAPLNPTTLSRLELTAVNTVTNVATRLKREMPRSVRLQNFLDRQQSGSWLHFKSSQDISSLRHKQNPSY